MNVKDAPFTNKVYKYYLQKFFTNTLYISMLRVTSKGDDENVEKYY